MPEGESRYASRAATSASVTAELTWPEPVARRVMASPSVGARRRSSGGVPERHVEQRTEESAPRRQPARDAAGIRSSGLRYETGSARAPRWACRRREGARQLVERWPRRLIQREGRVDGVSEERRQAALRRDRPRWTRALRPVTGCGRE